MKRESILMAVLIMAIFAWAKPAVAQKRVESTVIENPQFGVSNTNGQAISGV